MAGILNALSFKLEMAAIASTIILADTGLLVAVIALGELRKKARTGFICLSFPCGFLYPLIMLTWFSAVGVSHPPLSVARVAPFVFLLLAGFATLFYTSSVVSAQIEFKSKP